MWEVVCLQQDVSEGEAKSFFVQDKRLCIINDGSNFYAIDDLCTHGVAYLSEGFCDTSDCVVECPLHGGLFDYRDGSPQGCPAEKPVNSYNIILEDGKVMVKL